MQAQGFHRGRGLGRILAEKEPPSFSELQRATRFLDPPPPQHAVTWNQHALFSLWHGRDSRNDPIPCVGKQNA